MDAPLSWNCCASASMLSVPAPMIAAIPPASKKFLANVARSVKAASRPIFARNTDGRTPATSRASSEAARSASKPCASRCAWSATAGTALTARAAPHAGPPCARLAPPRRPARPYAHPRPQEAGRSARPAHVPAPRHALHCCQRRRRLIKQRIGRHARDRPFAAGNFHVTPPAHRGKPARDKARLQRSKQPACRLDLLKHAPCLRREIMRETLSIPRAARGIDDPAQRRLFGKDDLRVPRQPPRERIRHARRHSERRKQYRPFAPPAAAAKAAAVPRNRLV